MCWYERPRELFACGKCKAVYYCSKHCQKSDWPTHKALCFKPGEVHLYDMVGLDKPPCGWPVGRGADDIPKLPELEGNNVWQIIQARGQDEHGTRMWLIVQIGHLLFPRYPLPYKVVPETRIFSSIRSRHDARSMRGSIPDAVACRMTGDSGLFSMLQLRTVG